MKIMFSPLRKIEINEETEYIYKDMPGFNYDEAIEKIAKRERYIRSGFEYSPYAYATEYDWHEKLSSFGRVIYKYDEESDEIYAQIKRSGKIIVSIKLVPVDFEMNDRIVRISHKYIETVLDYLSYNINKKKGEEDRYTFAERVELGINFRSKDLKRDPSLKIYNKDLRGYGDLIMEYLLRLEKLSTYCMRKECSIFWL
jgi:hypothetical protein